MISRAIASEVDYGIVVHGGAGSFVQSSSKEFGKRRSDLARSASSGFKLLEGKGSATEAVEEAIRVMENSGAFNAGKGSCLTLDGKVYVDAAIMNGDLTCGAIGGANVVQNPIALARAVMERSDHVLLVGTENLERFARGIRFPVAPLSPSTLRLEQYRKYKREVLKHGLKEWPRNLALFRGYYNTNDTVGAVAIDAKGRVCAGVSTGGRWLKLPGRVGDSALVGAGIYAQESSGAACATGRGEEIIRLCLSKSVCDFMKLGADAQSACDAAIDMLTDNIGSGVAGVIAVDRLGRFGASRNTEMMTRAFRFKSMKKTYVAFLPEDTNPPPSYMGSRRKPLRF
jgi:beta-aspartyl-peptidase (threonine type)